MFQKVGQVCLMPALGGILSPTHNQAFTLPTLSSDLCEAAAAESRIFLKYSAAIKVNIKLYIFFNTPTDVTSVVI